MSDGTDVTMPHDPQLAQGGGAAQPGPAAPTWRDRLLGPFRRGRARREAARRLYGALVEQARQPVYYAAWGVPDSRDGRLGLVGLHAILLMRRLRTLGQDGQELAQALFDVMFVDVDQHLREWGVGDLSVGKHVKKLAQSFLGQAAALDEPLSRADRAAVADLLRRNVYTEVAAPDPVAVDRLADYLLTQERELARQEGGALIAGEVRFGAAAGP